MGVIPTEIIDRVREATDIVALVGQYVSLKASGASYKGLCPFHTEKTPSFLVNPSRQIFKCFGCGAGGNAFHFVMRMEGWSFGEAVRELAKRANVVVPASGTAGSEAQELERRRLVEVMAWAQDRFRQALGSPRIAAPVRAYLERRGVSDEMVDRFGLGYAPAGWDNLQRAARRDHFSEDLLTRAGLVSVNPERKRTYDRFRDRLMFPIRDVQGRPVAFGGRLLGEGEPKYLNSPETEIFHKGEMLYALDAARDAARRKGRFVLVEGYMDTIACHAAGVTEAVATMGTAMTAPQARLLRRYAERVVLIYDADAAGVEASLRAGELLLPAGLSVHVVALRGAKDPDEFIRAFGAEAFRQTLDRAQELVDYVLDVSLARPGADTVEGKLATVRRLVPFLARLPEGTAETALRRQEYAKQVSARLRLDEGQVRDLLAQELKKRPGREAAPRRAAAEAAVAGDIAGLDLAKGGSAHAEEELALGTILRHPGVWDRVRDRFAPEQFTAGPTRALASALAGAGVLDPDRAEDWLQRVLAGLSDPEAAAWVAGLAVRDDRVPVAATPVQAEQAALRVIDDCLQRLLAARLWERIGDAQARLRAAEAEGDLEDVKRILAQERDLKSRLAKLGVNWKPGRSGRA